MNSLILNSAEQSLEALKYGHTFILDLPLPKVTEKKQTNEMQAPYSSISAIKKPRYVKYQFPYRDVYLSCIILGIE